MIFAQGNHDHVDTVGLAKDGNNDPASGKYGVFVINENQRMEFNDDSSYDDTLQAANDLKTYLNEKINSGWTKPIFVLNHIPLHWSNRTIKDGSGIHANLLVDVLNEGGAKGLNIIYLFGHNHSGGNDDSMGGAAIYLKKGDQMTVGQGSKKKAETKTYTLNFTYMNAGYIGYFNTTEPTTDATLTMSVFLVRGNEVIITRYDSEINFNKNKFGIHNLKSAGVWHPDYSKEDYHATPDTKVYKSSRKVTATDDVEVEPPRYAAEEETTTTKPKTTGKTTATTTGKVSKTTGASAPTTGGIAPTQNTTAASTDTAGKITTTDKATQPTATDVIPTERPGGAVTEPVDGTTAATDGSTPTVPTAEAPSADVDPTAPQADPSPSQPEKSEKPEQPEDGFSVGGWIAIGGGAVLLIGGGIAAWLLYLKKKRA